MPASNRDGLASGLLMGVSIAFFFAIVIRFIQVGEARTAVATLLLWAFVWIVAAALLVAPQRAGKGA